MPFASHALLPPCSLPLQPSPPSHSASLITSLMPSILCRSAAHRQPIANPSSRARTQAPP
jgi:hypothetical protein